MKKIKISKIIQINIKILKTLSLILLDKQDLEKKT